MPNFVKIAKPLTHFLKIDEKFVWNEAQDKTFREKRDLLFSKSLLQDPDITKPFKVITDASGYDRRYIGGHETIRRDLPITFIFRLRNKFEQNYSIIEKELLAIAYSNFSDHTFMVGNSH